MLLDEAAAPVAHPIEDHGLFEPIFRWLLPDAGWPFPHHPPGAIVAIPAKNEADYIGRCLTGLADQEGIEPQAFAVVLLVNNSDDLTAVQARAMQDRLPFDLIVRELDLPEGLAHAGIARRLAMDLAGSWLRRTPSGPQVILTTDADSWVPPEWVAANLAAIENGVDAVAGWMSLFPEDEAALTAELRQRGAMEWHYEALLVEIDSLLDPVAHDPWPRHDVVSGASFALTLAAYDGVGGLPPVPQGEDRALAAALLQDGWRIRHDPAVRVVTSGRLDGRASGGAADTIRLRTQNPAAACDSRLEPVADAVLRARCRARLRARHAANLRTFAGAPVSALNRSAVAPYEPTFERYWAGMEAKSRHLTRRTLYPSDLPEQLEVGRNLLMSLKAEVLLKQCAEAGPVDTPPSALAAVPV